MNVSLSPSYIEGTVSAPPSKSMGHRYLICAALAQGRSAISNLEFSKDIEATLNCASAMGANVMGLRQGGAGHTALVSGCAGSPTLRTNPVFCGESGSTLRFFLPLFSLTRRAVTLTGAGLLMERPQQVYRQIFEERGLSFVHGGENGITVSGALPAGAYQLQGDVSSQFVSGLLFTLPLLGDDSVIRLIPPVESRSYIDLTIAALEKFGVHAYWVDEYTIAVPGRQTYKPCDMTVEADWSNAAFLAVLGARRGDVLLEGLDAASAQGDKVILNILRRCGCRITKEEKGYRFGYSKLIAPVSPIDLSNCPDLGPILMVLAAFCKGTTTILNAGRLRIKESDRIATMQQEMGKLGVRVDCIGDTIVIQGGGLHAPTVPLYGHNDHRIVMSLAVALLGAGVPGTITGAEAVSKSWPGFFDALKAIGGKVEFTDA